MPRLKKTITTAKRRAESDQKYYRRNAYDWQDPFPEIMGTSIEKKIYARLVTMGVRFIFQGELNVSLPQINLFKTYRPDFILPDVKIVMDPLGSYWHGTPQAIEADAYKYTLFKMMGYKVVAWWDYEIESLGLDALIARVPELNVYTKQRVDYSKVALPQNRSGIDDLKGLRTMNARKRKPYRNFVGAGRRSVRKAKTSYAKS